MHSSNRSSTWRAAGLALAALVLLAPAAAPIRTSAQGAQTALILHCDTGVWGAPNGREDITYREGVFQAWATDYFQDSFVEAVNIAYSNPDDPFDPQWTFTFSTEKLGHTVRVGRYEDAERAPFASPCHAGFEASQGYGGCNRYSADFTIYDVSIDFSQRDEYGQPKVVSFCASFEFYCDNNSTPHRGVIYYNSSAAPDLEAPVVSDVRPSTERVVRGQDPTVTLSWSAHDASAIDHYDVLFAANGSLYLTKVATGLSGSASSVTWTVPRSVPATSAGVFKVVAVDAAGNVGEALSTRPLTVE
jgi:hypothetical protein